MKTEWSEKKRLAAAFAGVIAVVAITIAINTIGDDAIRIIGKIVWKTIL